MPATYLNLNIHIIFATHGRAPMIADAWRDDLHAYMGGTVRGLGAKPYAVGGIADHVHLLIGIKATHCIADLVREVKKATSGWAAKRYSDFAWQSGYAALSISQSDCGRVIAYIVNQEQHHRTMSSAEELRALLEEFGIEFDERFFE